MSVRPSHSHLIKAAIIGKTADDKNDSGSETEEEKAAAPENDKEDGKEKGKKASPKTGKAKKGKKCDDDEDNDPGMEAEDEDDEEDDDEDEDDKEEKKKDGKKAGKSAKAIRERERARCRAILESGLGDEGRYACAARLAFHSSLSVANAIAIVQAQPAMPSGKRSSIDERMSAVQNPKVGLEPPLGTSAATGEALTMEALHKMSVSERSLAIVNAGRKRRNEEPLALLPGY